MRKITEKAPAKINLTLDVIGKRIDGYHDVEMIMTMVDLADRIELSEVRHTNIDVLCNAGHIPTDDRNLCYKAANALRNHLHINTGVQINIDKHIPVAAGLAGGSSDAAATLRGLNRLWNLGLSIDELAHIGASVGSDVPFCVYGGTAIARGRGEIIEHIESPPPCWVVLAKPPIGVSTAEIYGAFDLGGVERHPSALKMREAIQSQSMRSVCNQLGNVLESVTLELYPEVKYLKEQMVRFGANGVLMSGSGPTVFALVEKETRMNRIYNGLRGFCQTVYAVRLLRT